MGNTDNRLVGRIAVSDFDGEIHQEVMGDLFRRLLEPHKFVVGDLIIGFVPCIERFLPFVVKRADKKLVVHSVNGNHTGHTIVYALPLGYDTQHFCWFTYPFAK